MRYVIPLGVFIVLVILLAIGLRLDPRYVPSPLIDKPMPPFELPDLANEAAVLTNSDISGKPHLLNVWASWCAACRTEHPLLMRLAQSGETSILGLNYKDTRDDALAWLGRHGDPYTQTVFDHAGKLGLDLGVYGVPETFLIDSEGVIRYKQIGPITPDILESVIKPMLEILGRKN
ncbi:MAG TPA: DsbE family thiol:disulfide interchange protein [Gammaproteobacteria bacterium]|nr:DsbE family thiol:disulfide interchange protein [Gammaproteobacteria bacterium]|tara:strand:+ start:143 stop:670 length:528 start_codon:yes stop_codon:yes gene_type:complete